jgi:hypothetical protein
MVCGLCLCVPSDGIERYAQTLVLSGGLAIALEQSNHLGKSPLLVGTVREAAQVTSVERVAAKRGLQSRLGVRRFAGFPIRERFGDTGPVRPLSGLCRGPNRWFHRH